MVMAGKSWEIWPFELFLNCFTAKCTFCPELHSLEERGVRFTNAKWRKLSPIVQKMCKIVQKMCKIVQKMCQIVQNYGAQSSTIDIKVWNVCLAQKSDTGKSVKWPEHTKHTDNTQWAHRTRRMCGHHCANNDKKLFWGVTQCTVLFIKSLPGAGVIFLTLVGDSGPLHMWRIAGA